MEVDFTPLRDALRRCRSAGLPVPLWWRDDDAIEPTRPLDQLLGLADKTGCPVHLAVVPKHAKPSLTGALLGRPVIPVIHGWAHENHSPPEAKKSEFGHQRDGASVELEKAMSRMQTFFGNALFPMFVPPWNRIAPDICAQLPQFGYACVSTYGAREPQAAFPQINTHVDPIFWKQTRDLVPPDQLIALTVGTLDDRLAGRADGTEPLGLLTHHLVHTKSVWAFTEHWLTEMLEGGATPTNLHGELR